MIPTGGACAGHARLMDDHEQRALTLCATCPRLAKCRTWVMGLPHDQDPGGVCGGLTAHQRNKARWGDDPSPGDPRDCTACGRTKTRADFHHDPGHSDGLRSNCAECVAAYSAAYRARKKEQA